MSDGSTVIYVYDDTFEGLMTALFEAYAHKPPPESIVGRAHCQQLLGRDYVDIETDMVKAERVMAGIRLKIGYEAYEKIWVAFLSDDIQKGDKLYQYIRLGLEIGGRIYQRLADERVMAVDKISGLVSREAHQLIQFVRFSKMEGGIYYGEITPQFDVLSLMMPHFVARFHVQPFIIHDKGRHLAAVFDTREWVLISTEDMHIPALSEDELGYRRMWKTFYDTVAIKERINPNLRRSHMPKKFWKNMTEMSILPQEDVALPPAQNLKLRERPV